MGKERLSGKNQKGVDGWMVDWDGLILVETTSVLLVVVVVMVMVMVLMVMVVGRINVGWFLWGIGDGNSLD